ncbi:MAG: DinB family protein, partial [Caldilineaceae bacterium]
MTLLERLLGHDHDTTAEILRRCAELDDARLDEAVDASWGTVRETLDHLVFNVEVWTRMMAGEPATPPERANTLASLAERFDAAYAQFAALARQIDSAGRLDDIWTDTLDRPPSQKSFGGAIAHVILHNMHHRAE